MSRSKFHEWFGSRARSGHLSTKRTGRPRPLVRALRFEPLEDRRLLAIMNLSVEINEFVEIDEPDGIIGDHEYYAEVTIGNNPTQRGLVQPGERRAFQLGTFTEAINTADGPVRVVIHIFDHDAASPDDEMDVNPLPGKRGELVLFVNPHTGGLTNVTNENGRPFPDPDIPGLQGVSPGRFFSTGRDDFDPGTVYFDIQLGGPNVDSDSDGDGLLDIWEIWGIDATLPRRRASLSRQPDLRLPGSNPDHKDLYVEVDAMLGLAPDPSALDLVVQAFAAVPNALVNNPDGLRGVSLHPEEPLSGGPGFGD